MISMAEILTERRNQIVISKLIISHTIHHGLSCVARPAHSFIALCHSQCPCLDEREYVEYESECDSMTRFTPQTFLSLLLYLNAFIGFVSFSLAVLNPSQFLKNSLGLVPAQVLTHVMI